MELRDAKPVRWIGSSRADLQVFPVEPRTNVGYAIWLAQLGNKAPQAHDIALIRQRFKVAEADYRERGG